MKTATEWRERKQGLMSESAVALRKRLTKAIDNADRLPITVQAQAGDSDAFAVIAMELRSKGWAARWVDDQRDGNYIEIVIDT